MPIVLLGLVGVGAWMLLSKKSAAKTGTSTSAPSSDLRKQIDGLLSEEEDAAILRQWAAVLEAQGFLDDAIKLRAKADAVEARKETAPTDIIDPTTGRPVDWRTLTKPEDLARWIVLDAQSKGCWSWDTGTVSKFQRAMGLRDDGIIGPKVLGALGVYEPDSRNMFVNCGVLLTGSKRAPAGSPVSTEITEEQIKNLYITPDYNEGAALAREQIEEARRRQGQTDIPFNPYGGEPTNPFGRI